MIQILDGKKLSESILNNLKLEITKLDKKPSLSIILCGENPESILYANMKKKKGTEIGIKVDIHKFKQDINEDELISNIKNISQNSNGIIVQLPLPNHFNTEKITNSIPLNKDVDGLSSSNKFIPATPKGIMRLLQEHNIDLKSKNIIIINDSKIVGKPLANLMLNKGATVTICNKFTKDLKQHTKNADILVTGVGIPNFIKKDMIKKNVVLVDVGVSKKQNKIFGDINFEEVKEKASYITPVPGGVGPMTVAMLMENTLVAYKKLK